MNPCGQSTLLEILRAERKSQLRPDVNHLVFSSAQRIASVSVAVGPIS